MVPRYDAIKKNPPCLSLVALRAPRSSTGGLSLGDKYFNYENMPYSAQCPYYFPHGIT